MYISIWTSFTKDSVVIHHAIEQKKISYQTVYTVW